VERATSDTAEATAPREKKASRRSDG
jgi:hypothetical protein